MVWPASWDPLLDDPKGAHTAKRKLSFTIKRHHTMQGRMPPCIETLILPAPSVVPVVDVAGSLEDLHDCLASQSMVLVDSALCTQLRRRANKKSRTLFQNREAGTVTARYPEHENKTNPQGLLLVHLQNLPLAHGAVLGTVGCEVWLSVCSRRPAALLSHCTQQKHCSSGFWFAGA